MKNVLLCITKLTKYFSIDRYLSTIYCILVNVVDCYNYVCHSLQFLIWWNLAVEFGGGLLLTLERRFIKGFTEIITHSSSCVGVITMDIVHLAWKISEHEVEPSALYYLVYQPPIYYTTSFTTSWIVGEFSLCFI